MNCVEVRLLLGADPQGADPRLEGHLSVCEACRAYREEVRELDTRIRRTLLTDFPARAISSATESPPRRTQPTSRWLAFAASLLIAFTSAVAIWVVQAPSALAQDVIDHVALEPDAWSAHGVPTRSLEVVLAQAGVRLSPRAGAVTYAMSCRFRGQWVPHLVVRTTDGPVTVLILTHERASRPERFDEEGFAGIILPAHGGSIAVLSRGGARVEAQARILSAALTWSDPVAPSEKRNEEDSK